MHVLLAEDNPTNEVVARKLLTRLGHTSTAAHNGLEVLEVLRSGERFDCILMDIQMPEMDGIEAARRIREEFPDAAARPPIIAVTANAFETNRTACFAVGMVGFLTKPLRLAVLEKALDELVGATEVTALAGEIDFEHFDSIMDGGDEEVIEIFDDFCEATVEMLEEMAASESGPFAGMAHQLKGSLATFGLAALSERMGALEQLAGSGALDGLDPGWRESMRQDFLLAVGELRQRI